MYFTPKRWGQISGGEKGSVGQYAYVDSSPEPDGFVTKQLQ
jgi:ribosomal protein S8E